MASTHRNPEFRYLSLGGIYVHYKCQERREASCWFRSQLRKVFFLRSLGNHAQWRARGFDGCICSGDYEVTSAFCPLTLQAHVTMLAVKGFWGAWPTLWQNEVCEFEKFTSLNNFITISSRFPTYERWTFGQLACKAETHVLFCGLFLLNRILSMGL